MNVNLQNMRNVYETFSAMFPYNLWEYTVIPRVECSPPYVAEYDFSSPVLVSALPPLYPGDVLEIFTLDKRILLTGAKIEVIRPAPGLLITPVTNSGKLFDTIDASIYSNEVYAIGGGVLDSSVDLRYRAVIIDDPDYFGLRLSGSTANISQLQLGIQLAVSDCFDISVTPTNSQLRP